MSALQRGLNWTTVALMLVLLGGLVLRRLYRVSYAFTAYIVAVCVGDVLVLSWPKRFFTWDFFLVKESLYVVLKLLVALELTSLTFVAFPGASRTARRTLFLGLLATLAALVLWPSAGTDAAAIAQDLQPRLSNATALLFGILWGLMLWYNLPVQEFHAAILRGIVPYLLVSTVTLRLIKTAGWEIIDVSSYVSAVSYAFLVAYWAWSAWRRPRAAPAGPEIVRRLQPWRDRL